MVDESENIDDAQPRTAAEAAARAARMASTAARFAEHEEASALLTDVIARVASAVAHELALAPIVNIVLDQTVTTIGARFACVYLVEANARELKLLGHRNLPAELVDAVTTIPFDAPMLAARAARSGRMQLVPSRDALDELTTARELLSRAACQAAVALPLIAHGRLVGVHLFGLPERHEFTPEEEAAFQTCAEIFAFGIANAAIYEEERRLRCLFEAVGHAAVAIASELELRPVLQTIVDRARAVTNAEYAALGIVESPDRPFEPWVFSGLTEEQERRIGPHPRPVGTLGAVAWGRETIRIGDVRRHPAFAGFPPHHPVMISFLGVPVRYHGQSVGNLYLTNKRAAAGDGEVIAEFTEDDERAVELLAAHAGAALHQASLRQQLDGERARFTAIVENAPYGVVFVEISTERLIANQRAIELLGQAELATVAELTAQLCAPDGTTCDLAAWPARRVLRGEQIKTQEMLIRRSDGREIPVLLSAAPVLDRDGRTEGAVVVFEDISTLKELQRQREEWTSIVMHDLRQPLNVLALCLGTLQQIAKSPDPLRLHKTVERLRHASERLGRMIGDLADASCIETKRLALNRKAIELDTVVRELAERHRAMAPDRMIVVRVDDPIPTCDADQLRIEQVLDNLVENAIKYAAPETPIEIDVRRDGGDVRVSVTNRGAGIADGEAGKIFERYYRTSATRAGSARGLGLGLYIAKGIVEAHGGLIRVDSSPGGATTFHFTLPVIAPPAGA